MKHNVVVAITGASGATYAIRLLEVLSAAGSDVHLTISSAAQAVLKEELDLTVDLDNFNPSMLMLDEGPPPTDPKPKTTRSMAGISSDSSNVLAVGSGEPGKFHYYHYRDFLAPIASGSLMNDGGGVFPPSSGPRRAPIHLKEGRKLILVPREPPLSLVMLDNPRRAAEAGAIVLPAMPGFYHGVKSIQDLGDFIVARLCDQLGVAYSF